MNHKTYETVPGIFVQETHGNIEGRAAPHLQTEGVCKRVACLSRDVDHVNSTETGGEQRLVGISPGSVHDKGTGVSADCFGECLGALLDNDVAPPGEARRGDIQRRSILGVLAVLELRDDDVLPETGFALIAEFSRNDTEKTRICSTYNLTLNGATVYGEITKVGEQLLCAVLTLNQFEELGGIVNELFFKNKVRILFRGADML